jgi:hypothetical protein
MSNPTSTYEKRPFGKDGIITFLSQLVLQHLLIKDVSG